MKKILALITLVMTLFLANGQNLPMEANQFVGTFFPDYNIQGVAEYAASSPIAFTVELDNNVHIDFDANGAWLGVYAPEAGVPKALFSSDMIRIFSERGYKDLGSFASMEKANGVITVINQDGSGYVFDLNGRYLRDTDH
jgi:hypothetical protein